MVSPSHCHLPPPSISLPCAARRSGRFSPSWRHSRARFRPQLGAPPSGPILPTGVGRTSDPGPNGDGINLFAPDYKTPRSVQINFGVQRELRKGMVLTADYLRNISTHTLLAVDTNDVGDTRFLNIA